MQVDVELAKQVAELPEDDAPLRRKLWLSIARHLVESQPGVGDQRQRIRQVRRAPVCPAPFPTL